MFVVDERKKVSEKDLKAVGQCSLYRVVSGRDDKIHVIYTDDEETRVLDPQISHVNSLSVSESRLCAGGQAGLIAVYEDVYDSPHILVGHTKNVTSIAEKNDFLLSGSWDHTVRFWNLKSNMQILQFDMTDCVWCVKFVEGPKGYLPFDFIVGTADGFITVFKCNKISAKYKIHLKAVRGLELHGEDLYSVGNDGKVMKSTVDGKIMAVYDAKEFMYSILICRDKCLVVTGEKGKVILLDFSLNVIWSGTINAQSCWQSIVTESEILVAGSDGVLYSLKEGIEPSPTMNAKSSDCKSLDGDKTGAVLKDAALKDPNYKIEGGKVYFLQNEVWTLVGDVIEKDEFDHTFTVDVENKNLPISFNDGDDLYEVADNFISKNNLSTQYREEIVGFIQQNFKPKSSFYVYKDLNIEGIKKFLNDDFILENLKTPVLANNKEIEKRLFSLLNTEADNFFVLDCYRYFVAFGFSFDFCFLQDYPTETKKNGTVFLRLVCNIMKDPPYALEVLEGKVRNVIDKGLVDENTVSNYIKNKELIK